MFTVLSQAITIHERATLHSAVEAMKSEAHMQVQGLYHISETNCFRVSPQFRKEGVSLLFWPTAIVYYVAC